MIDWFDNDGRRGKPQWIGAFENGLFFITRTETGWTWLYLDENSQIVGRSKLAHTCTRRAKRDAERWSESLAVRKVT